MRLRRACWIAAALIVGDAHSPLAEDLDAPDPGFEEPSPEHWNEYDSRYFSIRAGGGMLIDYVDFDQSAASAEMMPVDATGGIRDLRLLVAGKLFTKNLIYSVGYMYDAANDKWLFRQTGLNIAVPRLNGMLFIGRTKEGFSTNKMTTGYFGWFNERSAANDAFLPILADGVRFTAAPFGGKLVYNLGGFNDVLSETESFNKNDWQFVGRAVWLPFAGPDSNQVLHLATEVRYAGSEDGFLQFRSKPEAFLAQSFAVDTGKFEADRSTIFGVEAYYLRAPFSGGGEYFFNQVQSTPARDPFFHGGEVFVAYMFTGETHPYNARSAVFEDVVPHRSLVDGGPGAWELAVRLSYVDLDDEMIAGGKFLRITPLLNWYPTDTVRFEAAYGYGMLDRMNMDGGTQFFQLRMQIVIPTK